MRSVEVRTSAGGGGSANEVVASELTAALDRQWADIEQLNTRASAILGFGGIIVTLAATVASQQDPPGSRGVVTGVLAIGAVIFGAVVWQSAQGWRPRHWYGAPEPDQLWKHYGAATEDAVRLRLIEHKLASYEKNREPLEAKKKRVLRAQQLLLLEVVYVLIALIALPYLP